MRRERLACVPIRQPHTTTTSTTAPDVNARALHFNNSHFAQVHTAKPGVGPEIRAQITNIASKLENFLSPPQTRGAPGGGPRARRCACKWPVVERHSSFAAPPAAGDEGRLGALSYVAAAAAASDSMRRPRPRRAPGVRVHQIEFDGATLSVVALAGCPPPPAVVM